MKVLMIAPYPFPECPIRGGVETVTYNLMEGFKAFPNVSIQVLSICQNKDDELSISPNIIVRYIKAQKSNRKAELLKHIRPLVLEIDRQWQPDIIHLQGNGSMFLLAHSSLSEKMVVTQHGIIKEEMKCCKKLRTKLNMFIALMIECSKRKYVKNWIFISKYNYYLSSQFIQDGQIHYKQIYNPVNPRYFIDTPLIKTEIIKLIFVGRIIPRKGISDLLKSIVLGNLSSKIELHVVGGFEDVSYEQEVKSYIHSNNLSDCIIIHGWKTADEIIEIEKECHVLILPSHQETLPCVIAEAMAMGKIVLASAIGGVPEMIVDNKTGFLFPPCNIERIVQLVDKVRKMSLIERDKIGKAAKQRAFNLYAPISVAASHIEFYKNIIKSKKEECCNL